MTIRFVRSALFLAVAVATGCATTTLGDKLGVDLSATGSTISLDWDPLHAWHPQLSRGGAELVAEYEVPGQGLVREVLGAVRPGRPHGLDFRLPEVLTGTPQGAVCLYVQIPGIRALLPVRKAAAGQDTARFRYHEWDSQVTARSEARYLSADAGTLAQQSQQLNALLERRQRVLAERGLADAASCVGLPASAASSAPVPIGVVSTEQQDAVARQVCIHRVGVSRRLLEARLSSTPADKRADLFRRFGSLALNVPEAAEILVRMHPGAEEVAPAALLARQQQARSVGEDWRRFAPSVGRDYWPPFGHQNDYLEAIGESHEANSYMLIQRYGQGAGVPLPGQAPSARDQFGALGAMMDAYLGCVEDGKRQLRAAADAWAALQSNVPQRELRVRDHFVAECRREFEQLETVREDARRLESELRRVRALLEAQGTPRFSLPTQRQSLNGSRCGGM